MSTPTTWPKRAHGVLRPLAENLWCVEGPVPRMWARRQMVVARDAQRRLLLHSVIALRPDAMAELEALGTPTWMVVPNGHHRLDAPAYKSRYPSLCVIAPAGSISRVQQVVPVDLSYTQLPAHDAFHLEPAPWPNAQEGVLRVRSRDGTTLVFNDLLWTPANTWHRWLRQRPQVPWLARRLLVRDTAALRAWLVKLSQLEGLVRVIPGHGAPILQDASAVLQRVAAELT